eukprot:314850-Prymnesium_polylepis.1
MCAKVEGVEGAGEDAQDQKGTRAEDPRLWRAGGGVACTQGRRRGAARRAGNDPIVHAADGRWAERTRAIAAAASHSVAACISAAASESSAAAASSCAAATRACAR